MNNPLLNKLNKDLKFVYSDNDTLSIIFNNNEILLGVVVEFESKLAAQKAFHSKVFQEYIDIHGLTSELSLSIYG